MITTFGRLGPHHTLARVRFGDPQGRTHEGIIEDIAHYLHTPPPGVAEGSTSVRLYESNVAVFAPHDWAVEILEVDEPADDALINLTPAYDDVFLELEATAYATGMTEVLARSLVNASFVSIAQAIADGLERLASSVPVNPDDPEYTEAQRHALFEAADWARELMPTDD